MKKNELISMVDFVRKQYLKLVEDFKPVCMNYANFLNTPLNISQFVPAIKVGDEWEVLDKYEFVPYNGHTDSCDCLECNKMYKQYEQYQTAKDNVIFEGCYIDEWGTIKTKWRDLWVDELKDLTIQDLIKYKPTLTKKGIEVSGLNNK